MGRVFLNKLTAPAAVTYQNLSAVVEELDWTSSATAGILQNDVVFGGVTTIPQTDIYAFAFNNPTYLENQVTGNDFTNLPPQQMVFSSDATTGPITLTKEVGQGTFTEKFIGVQIRVFTSTGAVIYTATEFVDANTLTVRYQSGPSQGRVLENLTNTAGGQGGNMAFLFTDVNGSPDPSLQFLRLSGFDEQTSAFYSDSNFIKGGSMGRYFNVPNNAVSIADFRELTPGSSGIPNGIRYYALIFDNVASYVVNAQGIRKIAKIEAGNTFMNVSNTYLAEDWEQAGGSLQFITPFAMERNSNNRVTHTEWEAATVFPSLAGVSQITVAIGMQPAQDNSDAKTQGIELTFNIQSVDTAVGFNDQNFITLELNMTEADVGNFVDIKAEWDKVQYYEVTAPNTIRFYGTVDTSNPIENIPIQVKVIK